MSTLGQYSARLKYIYLIKIFSSQLVQETCKRKLEGKLETHIMEYTLKGSWTVGIPATLTRQEQWADYVKLTRMSHLSVMASSCWVQPGIICWKGSIYEGRKGSSMKQKCALYSLLTRLSLSTQLTYSFK